MCRTGRAEQAANELLYIRRRVDMVYFPCAFTLVSVSSAGGRTRVETILVGREGAVAAVKSRQVAAYAASVKYAARLCAPVSVLERRKGNSRRCATCSPATPTAAGAMFSRGLNAITPQQRAARDHPAMERTATIRPRPRSSSPRCWAWGELHQPCDQASRRTEFADAPRSLGCATSTRSRRERAVATSRSPLISPVLRGPIRIGSGGRQQPWRDRTIASHRGCDLPWQAGITSRQQTHEWFATRLPIVSGTNGTRQGTG